MPLSHTAFSFILTYTALREKDGPSHSTEIFFLSFTDEQHSGSEKKIDDVG